MRIVIAAIGKLKAGPERELYEKFAVRISGTGRSAGFGGLELIELPESRLATPEARMADEAERLLSRTDSAGARVALDERGKSLASLDFAEQLKTLRAGTGDIAFLIGGPDGHGDDVRRRARLVLSLSAMTLPHGLARVFLAEQVYRAMTILTGHPYHRE